MPPCGGWPASRPTSTRRREATQRIVRDGQRAGEVITRLRSLFRQGRAHRRSGSAMNDVVHEVIAITRAEVQKGGAAIRTEMADDLPPVTGDRVQLQQLVLNLIMNAVEAMSGVQDRRREIVIGTREGEAGDVVVAVRDSGVGLEPDEQGQDLRRVLHHQADRDGHGAGDQPLHRGAPRRPAVGRAERRAGRDVPVHHSPKSRRPNRRPRKQKARCAPDLRRGRRPLDPRIAPRPAGVPGLHGGDLSVAQTFLDSDVRWPARTA